MTFKKLIDNLPWIVPSAALVFAASGYFQRPQPQQIVQQAAPAALPAPAPAAAVPAPAAPAPVALPVATAPAEPLHDVSRSEPELNMLPSSSKLDLPETAVETVRMETQTPAQKQTEAPTAANAAAFFGAAQAKLAEKNSCVGDLKRLAAKARVYFPSGGLAGEESGLTQARLIGLIAQECPGVIIRVEGHSDSSGDPQVNLRLSKKRAEAVIARVRASGVNTRQFVAVGMGHLQPSNVTGPETTNFYDRRVEFSVVQRKQPIEAKTTAATPQIWEPAPCVTKLQLAVQQTKVYYSTGSVTIAPKDIDAALELAKQAQDCSQARLRVVGQHSDQFGAGETATTGRLRAVVMMSTLVGAGIDPGKIIIAAPSWSVGIPGKTDTNNSRIDFDVIIEES